MFSILFSFASLFQIDDNFTASVECKVTPLIIAVFLKYSSGMYSVFFFSCFLLILFKVIVIGYGCMVKKLPCLHIMFMHKVRLQSCCIALWATVRYKYPQANSNLVNGFDRQKLKELSVCVPLLRQLVIVVILQVWIFVSSLTWATCLSMGKFGTEFVFCTFSIY